MEGGPGQEEDFSSLSIDDLLAHKSWKARMQAYTSLISTCKKALDGNEPELRQFVNNGEALKRMVTDSNAVAQEKGVECVACWVEAVGKPAGRARETVMPALVEKCLGSTRAGTKSKAIEICLLFVEVEDAKDGGEGVVSPVTEGLSAKQPKLVAGAVMALKELVKAYGVKTLNPKPILKILPKIFAHSDKTVRSEGTLLTQELYKFLGGALEPHLSELKPVQIKELNEGFAALDEKGEGKGKGVQNRFTRAQQRERDVKDAETALEGEKGEEVEETPEEPEEMDPFELAEPVAIASKIPENFYEKLASSKWKERKEEALDPLLAIVKVPRIKDNEYSDLIRALAGRMSDANIACVTAAANCIEAIAKGLREAFGKYKTIVTAPILEKLKEKKQSVVDALAAALDATFDSVTITEITEDIATFAKHKNPAVKTETLKWFIRCLKSTKVPPPRPDLKPILDTLIPCLEDSFEPVRASAQEALGTLMKIVGEKLLMPQLAGLDDLRQDKVKEFYEKAEVKCKVKPGAAAAPAAAGPAKKGPAAAAKGPAAKTKSSLSNKENISPPNSRPTSPPVSKPAAKAPAARPAAKKPAAAPSAAKPASSAAGKAPPKGGAPGPSEPIRYKYTQEDAEALAPTKLPTEIVEEIANSNWKLRLAAVENLHNLLSEGEVDELEAELVVRFLSKTPGWKESNFQVWGKVVAIFQLLAERSASFTKACCAIVIPPMSDKLGDIKLKKSVGDALIVFAEKTSLQFVMSQAYEPMTKQKAPKAQADSLLWVDQAIQDFGISGLSVRDLIEFLKNGLKSSNAAVRTNATKTLVSLKLFVGADITTFLQDLNPQLLATIETEFAKVDGQSPPTPTRMSAENAVAAAAGNAKGGKGKAEGDAMDELFPRVDLDKLISGAIISGCNDANWKNRKESLETIQGILEANKRLKPGLGDLASALKQRLVDSNKVVQGLALDIVSRIADGMGKPFERYAKNLAGPVATVLADQKTNIRAAGVSTLSAMADATGMDCLIGSVATSLEQANPVLRKELVAWLESRLEDKDVVASLDLAPLAAPIISCLEDRNADVRKAAQGVLPAIVARAGYDYVMDQTNTLKPASRATVVPMIDSARGSVPTAPSAPVARSASNAGSKGAGARPVSAVSKPLRGAAGSTLPRSATPSDDAPVVKARQIVKGGRAGVRAAPPVHAAPAPSVLEAPFVSGDPRGKQVRASKETGPLKWTIEGGPRADQVEYLHQQMGPHVSGELLGMLFSKDHHAERDFIAGLTLLNECLIDTVAAAAKYDIEEDELLGRFLANADVTFKYVSIRLYDTSTTITVKCLDLLESVLSVFQNSNQRLSDYEAGALLPSLLYKVGDGKETIRQRIRAILKTISSIYPFTSLFRSVMEHGLKSKNSRTRAESADELGVLIQRHGMGACQPPTKTIPIIAALISDRDSAVRTAALTAISKAYAIVGEVIYTYVGQLSGKDRTMLDEKLKRVPGGSTSPARMSAPVQASIGTPTRPESRLGAPGLPKPSGVSRLSTGTIRRPSSLQQPGTMSGAASPRAAPLSAATQIASPPRNSLRKDSAPQSSRISTLSEPGPSRQTDEDIRTTIEEILSSDPNRSVEALKVIQREITNNPVDLVEDVDALVDATTVQIGLAFEGLDATTPQSTLRLCKHLMQTLNALFNGTELGPAVSREALTKLLAELTQRLLVTANFPSSEAITSLSKILNMCLIRVFHHAERSACFGALFVVLQDATKDMRNLEGDELGERAKYAELVMKCLWKVSKTVKESLEENTLDPRRLLLDIDDFLNTTPPAEWRRRATDNVPLGDMPLRTVKTILQQIVSVKGEGVYDELALVDTPENSFVYQYLFRLLNNSKTLDGADDAGSSRTRSLSQPRIGGSPQSSRTNSTISLGAGSLHRSRPSESGGSLTSPGRSSMYANGGGDLHEHEPQPQGGALSGEVEINQRLKEIFDKIGRPQESKAGIAELYQFKRDNPHAEGKVDKWIKDTGTYFQSYLRRALQNLQNEEAEREGHATGAGLGGSGGNGGGGNGIGTAPLVLGTGVVSSLSRSQSQSNVRASRRESYSPNITHASGVDRMGMTRRESHPGVGAVDSPSRRSKIFYRASTAVDNAPPLPAVISPPTAPVPVSPSVSPRPRTMTESSLSDSSGAVATNGDGSSGSRQKLLQLQSMFGFQGPQPNGSTNGNHDLLDQHPNAPVGTTSLLYGGAFGGADLGRMKDRMTGLSRSTSNGTNSEE